MANKMAIVVKQSRNFIAFFQNHSISVIILLGLKKEEEEMDMTLLSS